MNEFEKLLTELREDIQELEETFIRRFINDRMTEPDEYEHHVKAYCVLCHAAFEKYFESIALKVMHRCLDEWIRLRKIYGYFSDTHIIL